MRFLIMGDTHGNLTHVERACQYAVQHDLDHILQVGDWGFLGNGRDRMWMLHDVLNKYAMTMSWLDGNHECFDLMEHLGIRTDADEPVACTSRITYLPRGYAWEEDGVGFMSFGGASSVDRPDRTAGFDWFHQELIKVSDIERALANAERQRVDVLFSHDAPSSQRLMNFLDQSKGFWEETELNVSAQNRLMLEEVIVEVDPTFVIHGHYHWGYNTLWNGAAIVGLDESSNTNSLLIFDTETFVEDYDAIYEAHA